MSSKKVKVTFNGEIVGWGDVNAESGVVEIEIEPSDLKRIMPDYNPVEGLSIAPDTDMNVLLDEIFHCNRPKGTFDS